MNGKGTPKMRSALSVLVTHDGATTRCHRFCFLPKKTPNAYMQMMPNYSCCRDRKHSTSLSVQMQNIEFFAFFVFFLVFVCLRSNIAVGVASDDFLPGPATSFANINADGDDRPTGRRLIDALFFFIENIIFGWVQWKYVKRNAAVEHIFMLFNCFEYKTLQIMNRERQGKISI